MPIIKSAKKAARQAEKRTEHNVEIKKAIKAALKAFKKNPTPETLAKAQSEYDKAVKKDLMKKNTASRRKAKLHDIAKKAGVKLEKKVAKTAAPKTTTKTTVAKKPAAKATTKKAAAKTTAPKAKTAKK
ncbi:30S ribosomal protein S20 [Candidatus Saccharibacteria bacterium]|nr:30S ribosomal protein S20 [Candidatus Saccharibacteria bacterium]